MWLLIHSCSLGENFSVNFLIPRCQVKNGGNKMRLPCKEPFLQTFFPILMIGKKDLNFLFYSIRNVDLSEQILQDFNLTQMQEIADRCRIADNLFIGYYGLVFLRKEYQLS